MASADVINSEARNQFSGVRDAETPVVGSTDYQYE